MRRSVRDGTREQEAAPPSTRTAGAPAERRALPRPAGGPAGPVALPHGAGNAAVSQVIQRMEAQPGKRRRSGSPEDQEPAKQAREADTSSEEFESSSEEEWEEPFSAESVAAIDREQTRLTQLLERMDEQGAPEHIKQAAEDKRQILTLLSNLTPLRSAETVREAIRLLGEMPDSASKTKYLASLRDQLAYLEAEFPSEGAPSAETVQAMWPSLAPSFGSAGGEVGQDGCEDRAHAICRAIADAAPAIAVHHLSKQWATPDGGRLHADHQWNHHVAASVTTTDGVLVIDPVFSREGPLALAEWARLVQVDLDTNVHETAWGFLGKPGPDNRPDANSAVK
ncbi:protein-glutamine glutaminase family protein [Streptomyces sp. NPDC001941]|uniref:protein-glutamine glutaminase family protein n=1 Tax=Streptomyces sp. NPDC001941 TaxID=3154659 RepID=UPI0033263EF9